MTEDFYFGEIETIDQEHKVSWEWNGDEENGQRLLQLFLYKINQNELTWDLIDGQFYLTSLNTETPTSTLNNISAQIIQILKNPNAQETIDSFDWIITKI